MHTLFFDFTHRPQAEHLKAAGIGEDRAVPVHEIVQIAMQFHDFLTRAQPQVESVAQQDLCAGIFNFFRGHAFYGAVSAHWHKCRGFDHATFKDQTSATCAAIGSA